MLSEYKIEINRWQKILKVIRTYNRCQPQTIDCNGDSSNPGLTQKTKIIAGSVWLNAGQSPWKAKKQRDHDIKVFFIGKSLLMDRGLETNLGFAICGETAGYRPGNKIL